MKLFVFDVDNTIVSHFGDKSRILDSTKEAIRGLNSDFEVAIATGRNYELTKEIAEELGIKHVICSNGCYIQSNGQIIFEKYFSDEDIALIKSYIFDNELHCVAFSNDKIYLNDVDNILVDYLNRDMNQLSHHVRIDELVDHLSNVSEKISLFSIYDVKAIYNDPKFHVLMWGDSGYEITLKGLDKAAGIDVLAKHLNVLDSNIYVFGDNYNDVSMFKKFYEHSNVLANAPEDIKDTAKFQCDHIDNDGLAKCISEIVKGEKYERD